MESFKFRRKLSAPRQLGIMLQVQVARLARRVFRANAATRVRWCGCGYGDCVLSMRVGNSMGLAARLVSSLAPALSLECSYGVHVSAPWWIMCRGTSSGHGHFGLCHAILTTILTYVCHCFKLLGFLLLGHSLTY